MLELKLLLFAIRQASAAPVVSKNGTSDTNSRIIIITVDILSFSTFPFFLLLGMLS